MSTYPRHRRVASKDRSADGKARAASGDSAAQPLRPTATDHVPEVDPRDRPGSAQPAGTRRPGALGWYRRALTLVYQITVVLN